MARKTVFLFSLLLALQVAAQPKARLLDSLLKGYAERQELNGCVLVAEGGKVTYQQAFGMANFETSVPNTLDTKFEIASITKNFTSIIILQLVEEGKLKLDGKVSDYLPDYPADKGKKISIRQLLLHTSGLTDNRFIENFYDHEEMEHWSREAFIGLFSNRDLLFEPGTKWSYSNFGYNLLAYIAEKICGKPYHELLKERIYDRCGMKNSTSMEAELVIPNAARGYTREFSDIRPGQYHDPSICFGVSSVVTTVGDYFLFHKALLGCKLLSKKYTDSLLTPYSTMSGELTGYQYHFDKLGLNKTDTITIIRTAGNNFGWHSVAYHQLKDDKLIVMFLNINTRKLFEIQDNMTNIVYGLPFEWPKESSYAKILFNDFESKGLTYGIRHHHELVKANYCKPVFRDLNRLGYFYMEKKKTELAIEAFKLNVELFPGMGDPYDSLGEAYAAAGNKELAIKNYEKALALDPANDNAKAMLAKLKGGN